MRKIPALAVLALTAAPGVVVAQTGARSPHPAARPSPRPAAPATGWVIKESKSPMDDSKTVTAILQAVSTVQAWPATVARPAIVLRCKEGSFEAYVNLGVRPIKDYRTDTATLMVRFDTSEALQLGGSLSTDGKAVFLSNSQSFADDVVGFEKLAMRFTPFNSNPQDTTFNLKGADKAMAAVKSACPASFPSPSAAPSPAS
jgi:type VI secretion system protein VasI